MKIYTELLKVFDASTLPWLHFILLEVEINFFFFFKPLTAKTEGELFLFVTWCSFEYILTFQAFIRPTIMIV